MRVLVLHNAYKLAGGEDTVVRNECELLRQHGHEVTELLVSNDNIRGFFGALAAGLGCVFSLRSFFRVLLLIRRVHPEVVHVHNFFPLLSPSVFYACKIAGVRSVLTLHNFRLICPTGTLFHNGSVSELSLSGNVWWAVRARVYRGSWLGTLAVALMIRVHHTLGTWRRCVDQFIVLTNFARDLFVKAGLPAGKILVKPNFCPEQSGCTKERSFALYAGRLTEEKGVAVLLEAIAQCTLSVPLVVMGDGPLRPEVARSSALIYRGQASHEEVLAEMRCAAVLVVPSVWYEGFPMVIAEAFAAGVPVIASDVGALHEIVRHAETGLLFKPGSAVELASALDWAFRNPDECRKMGEAARNEHQLKYSARSTYALLMNAYCAHEKGADV